MTEPEKSWLACAIDGEGFISLRNTIDPKTGWRVRCVEIGVVNTDQKFIDEALRLMGAGSLRILQPRGQIANTSYAGKKSVYNARLKHRDKVVAILKLIRPYLIIKGDKADAVVNFVETTDWTRIQTKAVRDSKSRKLKQKWADGTFTGSKGMKIHRKASV